MQSQPKAHSAQTWLFTLIALHTQAWILVPLWFHDAPPLDVVELLTLHNTGAIANYKHPNLPGLLLNGLLWLGFNLHLAYLALSTLSIATALILVFRLSRYFVADWRAAASSALLLGIYYYTWPIPEFNHNVLQIPLWAAILLSAYRAVNLNRWQEWTLLGTLSALLIWTKYSGGILLLCILLWLLYEPQARKRFTTLGPWIALISFLVVAYPQFDYLISSHFLPLTYAINRASGETTPIYSFYLAQLADHIPMLLLLLLSGALWRGSLVRSREQASSYELDDSTKSTITDPKASVFILFLGLGPLLLLLVLSLFGGLNLRAMWGAPMFNLSGLAFVLFCGGRLDSKRIRKVIIGAGIMTVILALLYGYQHSLREASGKKPLRTQWPVTQLSLELNQAVPATQSLIIAGPYWEAGLVSLALGLQNPVAVDADPIKSVNGFSESVRIEANRSVLMVWSNPNQLTHEMLTLIQKRGSSVGLAKTISLDWAEGSPAITMSILFLNSTD